MLPLHLDWSAPPDCPTGQEVEQELSRMARARAGRELVPLDARAVITQNGDSYHLALELTRKGEQSQAHFDSKVCAPLRKAATLVLALAYGDGVEIKDDASDDAQNEARAAQPVELRQAQTTTPERERELERERDDGDERRRARLRITPWLGIALTSGFVGQSASGVELGLALNRRYFSLFGRLSAFPPTVAATTGDVSAELSAITGGLGGCADWPHASFTLAGCATFEAGVVRAHSSGAVVDGSASAPWLAVNPAVALLVPLSHPFALRAELGALVPFDAPRFDVTSVGTLYATSRVGVRSSLALAVNL